ncbi:Asp23/Gls24 family envelope stress response protein [Fictibacillus phosphorivorans]|uniref:Asp23/Gls24 family envelope stress response protein n=1 Tax=Fictibacillus phosphorivorans TaxID=1221500 RepID=UPI0020409A42|nr:Asp23/Gls24 family envelope stress response protein [Fictibacillus phosphorivorans]MCM3716754.1 Asp23/Gls24 family envelope stress response protein [Fictibacillus phosphorivorans]MCM3774697.1 Asp23/Gls24 family envelope stress response protein [Fictibacillus phosphorivorans]
MNELSFEMESYSSELGKVEISPEVIEVIASIAASDVDGVASMRGSFASGVVERLGKKTHGKGVKVELSEAGISIDIYVSMKYGVSIPDVAQKIQDHVRQALLDMTALEATDINVFVVGVQFDSKEKPYEAPEVD